MELSFESCWAAVTAAAVAGDAAPNPGSATTNVVAQHRLAVEAKRQRRSPTLFATAAASIMIQYILGWVLLGAVARCVDEYLRITLAASTTGMLCGVRSCG